MFTAVQSASYLGLSPFDDSEDLSKKLKVLRNSYNQLEEQIQNITRDLPSDQIRIARLRQLQKNLKSQIERLHSDLYPNIVA